MPIPQALGDSLQLADNLPESRKILQKSLEIGQCLQSPNDIAASLLSLGNHAHAERKILEAIAFHQQVGKVSSSLLTKVQAQLNQLKLMIDHLQSSAAHTLLPVIQSQI